MNQSLLRSAGRAMAVFVVVLVGSALPPVSTSADTASDGSATEAYLSARLALVDRGAKELPATRAAVEKAASNLSGTCAGVLSDAPRGQELSELEREVTLTLTVVPFHLRLDEFEEFSNEASMLHWSSGALTDLVRSASAADEAEARLAYPNLCTDLRRWARSRYVTVPATTRRFLNGIEAIQNMTAREERVLGSPLQSADEIIMGRLRLYIPPGSRSRIREVQRLESAVGAAEERIVVTDITQLRMALAGEGPSR
jgi:hypothetical protein